MKTYFLSLRYFLIDNSLTIKKFIKQLIYKGNYDIYDKYIEYIIFNHVVIKGEDLFFVFECLRTILFNYSSFTEYAKNKPIGFFCRYVKHPSKFLRDKWGFYSLSQILMKLYTYLIEKIEYYIKYYKIKTTKPFKFIYTEEEYIKMKREEKINKYKDDENFNPFKCQEGNRDIKNGDYTLLYLYIYKEIVKGVKNEGYNNFNSVIESLKYKIFGDNYDNTFYCYISDRNYGYLEFNEFSDDYNLGVEGYYYIKMQFKLLVEKMRKKLNPENNN